MPQALGRGAVGRGTTVDVQGVAQGQLLRNGDGADGNDAVAPCFRIEVTHLERLFPDPASQDSFRQHVRGGGGLLLPMTAAPASAIPGSVGEGRRSRQHGKRGAEHPAKGAAP